MIEKTISTQRVLANKLEAAGIKNALAILKRNAFRYDRGKYKVEGSGLKNRSHDKDCPIWYRIQFDKDGKYIALWTVHDNEETRAIRELFEKTPEAVEE